MMTARKPDRDWEHWSATRRPDDRRRFGLRALFSPTDQPQAVEELIDERSHELEQRAEELHAAIADLERREEQALLLRTAVEEMLRQGSGELDDRHAELSELAAELATREESIAVSELALAERRRELGAVELLRASVDRREASVSEREESLERLAAELGERERSLTSVEQRIVELVARDVELDARAAQLDAREAHRHDLEEPTRTPEASHLLFLPGDRYRLDEAAGRAPEVAGEIVHGGVRYRVARVGRSPLPGDPRRCAYLELEPERFGSSAQRTEDRQQA